MASDDFEPLQDRKHRYESEPDPETGKAKNNQDSKDPSFDRGPALAPAFYALAFPAKDIVTGQGIADGTIHGEVHRSCLE